eukprot:613367-Rhodomonas_salina.1
MLELMYTEDLAVPGYPGTRVPGRTSYRSTHRPGQLNTGTPGTLGWFCRSKDNTSTFERILFSKFMTGKNKWISRLEQWNIGTMEEALVRVVLSSAEVLG